MLVEDFNFEDEVIIINDFNDCIIGKNYTTGGAAYSIEKIIEKIIIDLNLSFEEATEHFDFNIGCSYMGEYSPIFIWEMEASK